MSAYFTLQGKEAVFLSKFAKNKIIIMIKSRKTNTWGRCVGGTPNIMAIATLSMMYDLYGK